MTRTKRTRSYSKFGLLGRARSIRCPTLNGPPNQPSLRRSRTGISRRVLKTCRVTAINKRANQWATNSNRMPQCPIPGTTFRKPPKDPLLAETSKNIFVLQKQLNISAFQYRHSPTHLTIAADGDQPGFAAALRLAERASRLGWEVALLAAPEGHDWNDVLVRKGTE